MPGATHKTTERANKNPWLGREFLMGLLLLAATIFLYLPAGRLSFLSWDDDQYVTENPHVQSGLHWANTAWAFTSVEAANWHPLTWLSHMADCQMFGLNPAGAHYTNVFFHAANVLLLFFLLLKATGYPWRSFLVSALFALHPINIESVAWIAERKNVLSTFFLLIAFGCYGWYVKNPNWKRYLAVAGAFAASLMAKPMAVTFPFALLLLDYWPLGRLPDPGEQVPSARGRTAWAGQLRRLALEKLPLLLLAVASSAITLVAQKQGGAMHPEVALRIPSRLGNAMYSYVEYVRMMFWPARLSAFYPYPVLSPLAILLSVLFVAGVTVLVVVFRWRKYLLFGWLFFLGTLVPVIGVVQVGKQAMADRYAYIPLLGLFVIVIWLAAEAVATLRVPRWVVMGAAACLLLAAAGVTRIDLRYWQDSITLFTRARVLAPRTDITIETKLGEALLDAGRLDEGLDHFRLADEVFINIQDYMVHYNLGTTLMRKGQPAQAVPAFQAAIQSSNNQAMTVSSFNNLGLAYLRMGNLDAAWKNFTAALSLDPNHYQSMAGRGMVLYHQARYAEAADEFSRAVRLYPSPEGWMLVAKTLDVQGKSPEALAAYQQALQMNPGLTAASQRIAALTSPR